MFARFTSTARLAPLAPAPTRLASTAVAAAGCKSTRPSLILARGTFVGEKARLLSFRSNAPRHLSTTAAVRQQAAPVAGESASPTPSGPNLSGTPNDAGAKDKDGAGWRFTEWVVDNPKLFLAILVSILATWGIRSNVADSRETELVRQLESESPLASREIAALSRENRLPLHVVAAFARLLLTSNDNNSNGSASSLPPAISVHEAVALLRVLLQLQHFNDFLRAELKAPGSFADSLKRAAAASQNDKKPAATQPSKAKAMTPELEAAISAVALEFQPLLEAEASASAPAPAPSPVAAATATATVAKEDVVAALKRMIEAAGNSPDALPLPFFSAPSSSLSPSSSSASELLLKAREQGIVGSYVLERAAFLLSQAYPTAFGPSSSATTNTDGTGSSNNSGGDFVPISLLHTSELQRRITSQQDKAEQLPTQPTITASSHGKQHSSSSAVAGSWTHGSFLEHSMNPTHYAYEAVKEHELHRPAVDLVMGEEAATTAKMHPLVAFSLLGVLMGGKTEDLPVVKSKEQEEKDRKKKEEEEEARKKKEATTAEGGSGSLPPLPDLADVPPLPPLPPAPRTASAPLPTPSERLALYLSVLRDYRARVRARTQSAGAAGDSNSIGRASGHDALSAARTMASTLASTPLDGQLLPSSNNDDVEDIFKSTFTAEEVCDLIDLLAATHQIPPRFRVYLPDGFFTARRWPLPKQSLKPSPYHLINSLEFELQMHKAKENPVTVLPAKEAAPATAEPESAAATGPRRFVKRSSSTEADDEEEFFPWRTWRTAAALERQRRLGAASSPSQAQAQAQMQALRDTLSLSRDVPDEDVLLPSLSRELSFDEVRRIMFSRGVCAWGECLVTWYQGHRSSNKWFQ